VLACVGVAVVLGFIKYRQIEAAIAFGASFPEPMETVETARVLSATAQSATAVTGEVVATRSISLVNELPGRIVTVGFAGGDRVASGQTLLQLDDSEESAALTAAAAEAELARLDLARSERLLPTGATARESFERNRARAAAPAADLPDPGAVVSVHVPLVLVTGAGAEARNSIGIVLVAGMLIGTVFTLFVLPSIYCLLGSQSERR
jgi:membrane fusion protein (multidrug efflux system)